MHTEGGLLGAHRGRTERVSLSGRAIPYLQSGPPVGSCGPGGDRLWYDGFQTRRRDIMADGVVSKDEVKRWLADCYSVEFTYKSDPENGLSSYLVRGRRATGRRLRSAATPDRRPRSKPCSTCWPGSSS